jgi:PAS domain S-box-containing protein
MHEKIGNSKDDNKEMIKSLIKKLHDGENPDKVREEFKDLIRGLTPLQISVAEEQLIKEGMPAEEIHHMCDVHLAVMQETITEDMNLAPEGHPVNILMQEHTILLEYANDLRNLYKDIKEKNSLEEIDEEMKKIISIIDHFKASESHYLREENILFSVLEKYGVTQPPKIMWMEHDRVRDIEKNLYSLIEKRDKLAYTDFLNQFHTYAHGLAELLSSHFSKENKVLYPTAMQLFSESEWKDIREQFDDIGYCCFTPELPEEKEKQAKEEVAMKDGEVDLGTGKLSLEVLKTLFEHLPIDITFVGKDDTVKFYSEGPNRIFVRTPSVIGRLVENCHPDKSVDRVLEIIEGFKNNTLDKAEFWLNLNGRMIFIRYFPVRNKNGEYLGVLEVTQDITAIQKLEGEKRLL